MEANRPDGIYTAIDSLEKLDKLVSLFQSLDEFSLDTETTGKDWQHAEIVGISLSHKPGFGYYIPIKNPKVTTLSLTAILNTCLDLKEVQKRMNPLLKSEKRIFLHNAKYDIHIMRKSGMPLGENIYDTMIAMWIMENRQGIRYGLKPLTKKLFNFDMYELKSLLKDGLTFQDLSLNVATLYASADADMTMRLAKLLLERMPKSLNFILQLEFDLLWVLVEMEVNGVKINLKKFNSLAEKCKNKMLEIREEISKHTNIDIGSPQQLSKYLFEELKLPTKYNKKGASGFYGTGKKVLQSLRNKSPIVQLILDFREMRKLYTTYYLPIPILADSKSRIHSSFSSLRKNDQGITTGRLSSSDTNLQNIPMKVRYAIEAEKGSKLFAIDYSQQEVRILAHHSQEQTLIDALSKQDADVHCDVLAMLNKLQGTGIDDPEELKKIYNDGLHPDNRNVSNSRKKAKIVTFGVAYGKTKYGFAKDMGMTVEESEHFINEVYFKALPGIKLYIDKTQKSVIENGYTETFLGRRRYYQLKGSSDKYQREKILREAVNMPIQGGGADIVKLAMVACHKYLKNNEFLTKIIIQVHDEIVFEVPDKEAATVIPEIQKIMSSVVSLSVPMTVDVEVGDNWGDQTKWVQ